MRLWRIETLEFLPTAMEGAGARLYGGRWNRKGTPLVYFSTSLSLAAHEKFVHVPRSARYKALVALGLEVPGALVQAAARPSALPAAWRSPDPQIAAQDWGSAWAAGGSSLLAAVPSALLPLDLYAESCEYNLLINPLHPDLASVVKAAELPFHFDPRAWKD